MNSYPTTQKVRELTHSKKKMFFFMASAQYQVSTGWSGGSCSYYSLMNFKTGQDIPLQGVGDQFSKCSVAQEMPPNSILIETGVFNGKPSWPRIMCRPEQEQEVKQYLGMQS